MAPGGCLVNNSRGTCRISQRRERLGFYMVVIGCDLMARKITVYLVVLQVIALFHYDSYVNAASLVEDMDFGEHAGVYFPGLGLYEPGVPARIFYFY